MQNNQNRDSFVFYRSFYEAIKELPKEQQAEVYHAVMEYSLNFNVIELSGIPHAIFTLIKPQIEANHKRYLNGLKPKNKQNESKTEANNKQNESKSVANVNDNVNDNDNVNNNIEKNMAFSTFWECYNYKVGKGHAIKTFNKLKQKDINSILEVVQSKQFQDKQKELIKSNGDFRKHPNTWLNSQGWEDEVSESKNNTSQDINDGVDYELLAKLKGNR